MPVNLAINTHSSVAISPPAPEEEELASPLIENIDSINLSATEFNRPPSAGLPPTRLGWLKNLWRQQTHQPLASDIEEAVSPPVKIALREEIARQKAVRRKVARDSLAWTTGLLTLGVSAIAFTAYVCLRLKNDHASGAGRTPLHPEQVPQPADSENEGIS